MEVKTTLSVGPKVFSDEEFERFAREVAGPDLEGWEYFVESTGVTIHRRYKEVSSYCT